MARGTHFDMVFSGPAERHRRTASIAIAAAANGKSHWPETVILPEFDEFPGEQIVRTFAPILMERHARVREMGEAFERASTKDEQKRTLDILFPEVARRWVGAEVCSSEVESWCEFVGRVSAGVEKVQGMTGCGRSAVVFTSAGPTAVAVGMALELSPLKTLELAFTPRNASYSEFCLTADQTRLKTFNTFPHLFEPELLTYR
jgi:broad specificity phosphatase PhoE